MGETIYLDNAATTKLSEGAFKRMLPFLQEEYGNPSSIYDIGVSNKKAIQKAREQIAKSSFAVVVNCLARSIMFEKENLFSEFTDTLKNNYGNYIGVSGYGEQCNITHMNQTMILVLFE